MAAIAYELQWLSYLLKDLQVHQEIITLFCHNKAALYIATNPVFHERT